MLTFDYSLHITIESDFYLCFSKFEYLLAAILNVVCNSYSANLSSSEKVGFGSAIIPCNHQEGRALEIAFDNANKCKSI